MNKFLLFFIFIYSVSFSQTSNSPTVETIDNDFSKNLITQNIKIIDVRTPKEFNNGHIPNATNIDIKSSDFMTKISNLNKKIPYLIYCKSGNRSGKASAIMDSLGFSKIYDLKGGFSKWSLENKK
tara:strand:+ start:334 stop:708 length:375 start_codon:yes stop_codon:yes gene_type:complete